MSLRRDNVYVVLAVVLTPAITINYCKEVHCVQGLHTMCKFPDPGLGPDCKSFGDQGLSDSDAKVLLDLHNKWRDYLAAGKETRTTDGPMPLAANMGALTWNSEIAKVAQRWADQCHYGHDKCRNSPKQLVGQNVVFSGTSYREAPNVTYMGIAWYADEVPMYSASAVDRVDFERETGHFTQWIWATTYQLGCGQSAYKEDGLYKYFLVCNYLPAGNWYRRTIYTQGEPCSACPNGTTCAGDSRYPHLCSADGGVLPDVSNGSVPSGAAAPPAATGFVGCLLAIVRFGHCL